MLKSPLDKVHNMYTEMFNPYILNQRICLSREYTSGFSAKITPDFGVKTIAKLTPNCLLREKSKTGIQQLSVHSYPDSNFWENFQTYTLYNILFLCSKPSIYYFVHISYIFVYVQSFSFCCASAIYIWCEAYLLQTSSLTPLLSNSLRPSFRQILCCKQALFLPARSFEFLCKWCFLWN